MEDPKAPVKAELDLITAGVAGRGAAQRMERTAYNPVIGDVGQMLKFGLLIVMCAALMAQTAEKKQTGEVLFTNNTSKPFASLGCHVGYSGEDDCDVDLARGWRYSESLEEVVNARTALKFERLPLLQLKGLTRIDFLPFSKEEQAVFKAANLFCFEPYQQCEMRKVSLTFGAGKTETKRTLFVELDPVTFARGPRDEKYRYTDYDIAAVVIHR